MWSVLGGWEACRWLDVKDGDTAGVERRNVRLGRRLARGVGMNG
ncbi:hypothetical protein [Paenibacillus pectinilyticus]|nr:hypothetical protein [Paenibacillus pectinilyticus]